MNNITVLIKELRQATGAGFLDCKQALLTHDGNYEQATAYLRQKNLKKATKKAERQTSEGLVIVKSNENNVCAIELNCETDFVALTPDFKAFSHDLANLVLANESLTTVAKLETAVFPSKPDQNVHAAIQTLIGKLGENIKLGHVARYMSTLNTFIHGFIHAGAINGYGQDEGRLGVLVELELEDKTAVSKQAAQIIAHDLALHIASAAPRYVSVADIPNEVLVDKQAQLQMQFAAENKPAALKDKIIAGRLNKFYQANCLMMQPFIKDDTLTVADWLEAESEGLGTAVTIKSFTRLAINAH